MPKVLSRSPTESTRNTRKSTALETARTRDRAVALEISVRVAVPRRSSALPPARRTSVHAELTTSSQTTFVRDESSLREPRDATIVTCLASPPKRHRKIRHALRWHETAQGTTRPPKAVRLARAFARRSAFSRVARARDGRSVDRASRAEAPFHATVPTPLGDRRSTRRPAAFHPDSVARTRVGSSRGAPGVLRERPLACARRARPPRRARASPRRARRPRRTTAGAPLASARLETVGRRLRRAGAGASRVCPRLFFLQAFS